MSYFLRVSNCLLLMNWLRHDGLLHLIWINKLPLWGIYLDLEISIYFFSICGMKFEWMNEWSVLMDDLFRLLGWSSTANDRRDGFFLHFQKLFWHKLVFLEVLFKFFFYSFIQINVIHDSWLFITGICRWSGLSRMELESARNMKIKCVLCFDWWIKRVFFATQKLWLKCTVWAIFGAYSGGSRARFHEKCCSTNITNDQ